MTAEIALLNRESIALAADSAVTLNDESGQKIFTSANKIFTLSKYHPIGIMVYGNANYMHIPWETIIKIYREYLGNKKFQTLRGYAENFMNFLQKNVSLIPKVEQENYMRAAVYGYFEDIKLNIETALKREIKKRKSLTRKEISIIVDLEIDNHYQIWKLAKLIKKIPRNFYANFQKNNSNTIREIRRQIFQLLPVSLKSVRKLNKVAVSLFTKFPDEISKFGTSGVVIAGFGDSEIFPSLSSYLVEGVVENFLKYKLEVYNKIGEDHTSSISPFAQSEVVATFIEGVEPFYQNVIEKGFIEILRKYPDAILNQLKILNKRNKSKILKNSKRISDELISNYFNSLKKMRRANYIDPIMKVVDMLPKSELASLAESFINLTTLKRKVSMSAETVGGPVDVAVISKGDGFIWIKRKHYFEPELNQHFFNNYFKSNKNENQTKSKTRKISFVY